MKQASYVLAQTELFLSNSRRANARIVLHKHLSETPRSPHSGGVKVLERAWHVPEAHEVGVEPDRRGCQRHYQLKDSPVTNSVLDRQESPLPDVGFGGIENGVLEKAQACHHHDVQLARNKNRHLAKKLGRTVLVGLAFHVDGSHLHVVSHRAHLPVGVPYCLYKYYYIIFFKIEQNKNSPLRESSSF